MSGYLPYEITKSIEEVITDPELARKVIETIEKSLSVIESVKGKINSPGKGP